jgi:hypothetical protein
VDPVSLPARVATLVVAFLAVVAGVLFVVFDIIGAQPATENYVPYASGGQVNVTMMTTAQTTVTNKPDWVSYFIQNPSTKQFDHTTYFSVPANTTVNMTIEGYDGCTPLRNPLWGKVAGTVGDVEDVQYYNNGKTPGPTEAISTFDSWANCSVQHTFAIPSLGLNVPIASVTTLNENNNLCGTSPCTAANGTNTAPHTVVKFSFKTPSTPGSYRWQCFVPCGLGYVDGNGGPMGTPGYMMGEMEVQS